MAHWKSKVFSIIFTACLYITNVSGCTVVHDPDVPAGQFLHSWIYDTFRGNFWQNQTTDIVGIQAASNSRYYDIDIVNSLYVLSTKPLFDLYEEYEVLESLMTSATFRCTDGSSSRAFSVWVHVIDTNNNSPRFIEPPGGFVFNVTAPTPPGFVITGCINDMIVRDIDLTTNKIIFEIEENPYFEIEKEVLRSGFTPKNFSAIIRTKTFIRSFPEKLTLTVSATDNDRTNDPPRTTTTTVTFIGISGFELPEEPVFSKTFYLANYTADNRVVLTEPITLQKGFDELVKFDIEGDFSANFELESNPDHANQKSIRVIKHLDSDVFRQTNIHLIVSAEREQTSGASATIVLRLPEVSTEQVIMRFSQKTYIGAIENNVLTVENISLSSGYGEDAEFILTGNFSDHFALSLNDGGVLSLFLIHPLPVAATENTFIVLEMQARRERAVSAWTSVVIEIITPEIVAPVFTQAYYRGAYNAESGLYYKEVISLSQGYDETVSFFLVGEYSSLFTLSAVNPNSLIITASAPIPDEALQVNRQFLFSVVAAKPGALVARAAVSIEIIRGRPNGTPKCRCRPQLATWASQIQPSQTSPATHTEDLQCDE
ncbi:hypothetical protein PYW08_014752 [Mythimna loreyi]|uniref:Uncharacterized protein n=1 Tax=Mythimna loreyi TaxID=667449 RepID=A0ACC2R420_9NEOP|nr:hypothetical protein PYW08_014752 [Mythimna loreyi]